MYIAALLIISVVIQLCASFFALRLVKITGKRTAWHLIAIAIFLMSVRRILTLYHMFFGAAPHVAPDPLTEIVALVSSTLMFLGVLYIAPLFTAIKKAQQALKDSEEKYRTIVETAQEGIWLLDAEHRTTYVNQRLAEMLGYTAGEMMGRSIFDFMDQVRIPEAQERLARRKQGEKDIAEFYFLRKDSSHIWAIVSANPLFDELGNYAGSLRMMIDITERKRIEEMVVQERNRLINIINSMGDGVYIANEQYEILYVNPVFEKEFGLPGGRKCFEYFHGYK